MQNNIGQPKICIACGTQYPSKVVPEYCTICKEDRQYIPPEEGQKWATHNQLLKAHSNRILKVKDRIYELKMVPSFAIG